jgi:two-component system cell cycle response regulator
VTQPELLRDPESGLLSGAFFRETLGYRIAAGRRMLHPVSIALVRVSRRALVADVVAALHDTLREADIACRLEDGTYAILLEDTPESGAIWSVERLNRRLTPGDDGPTVWAGVACYPAHALDAADLLARTEAALSAACDWPQHRIEVAVSD